MRIGLFSDIHLEHCRTNDKSPWSQRSVLKNLWEQTQDLKLDLIVNAGDTHHDAGVRAHTKNVVADYCPYIDVLGNHDLWSNDWYSGSTVGTRTEGDFNIMYGSMWTNFNNNDCEAALASIYINDFRYIHNIELEDVIKRFNLFLAYVELNKPDIVVSHFAPSPMSIHPKYAGSDLNSYFCPDALGLLTHKPRLWLHGHIHDPVEYEYNTPTSCTRVVANPMGYPGETYKSVNDYKIKVIEIE